jgi:hypothetical protein
MRVTIRNSGANPIRVVIDKDTVDDLMLEADAQSDFDSRDQGTIELRELGSADQVAEPKGAENREEEGA